MTLELSNVANLPITLWPGMKIGQLCVFRLTSPAEHPYGAGGELLPLPGPARADPVEIVDALADLADLGRYCPQWAFLLTPVSGVSRANRLNRVCYPA